MDGIAFGKMPEAFFNNSEDVSALQRPFGLGLDLKNERFKGE